MRRDDALKTIDEHKEDLYALGVKALWLFGSVVRDEATSNSDVDVLVELGRPMGLFGLGAIQVRLEEILGCRVDLGIRGSIRPELKENIEAEMLRAA